MALTENPPLEMLLAKYPVPVQELYWEAHAWLLGQCPDLTVEVDAKSAVVGYMLGPGYKGTVGTIILSQKGLKLGLSNSVGFADPYGLLQGEGKVHRHVVLKANGVDGQAGLSDLLGLAIAACKARLAGK